MKRDKDYKVTIIKNNTFSECMYLKAASEKDAVRIIHPHDRPSFLVASTKGMMSKFKEPFSIEYRALKKDGTYVHVKVHMSGIQQPDKTYMLITNYVLI